MLRTSTCLYSVRYSTVLLMRSSEFQRMNESDSSDIDFFGETDDEDNNDEIAINPNPEAYSVAYRLIKNHPLQKVFRKVKTKSRTPEEIMAFTEEVEEYLRSLFGFQFCFARYQGRQGQFVKCSCLNFYEQDCSYSDLAARLGELFCPLIPLFLLQ
jgi:hypothetical protein